eukprot:scaffold29359_cov17-Prasinocladus_malaysianus.AAC.1
MVFPHPGMRLRDRLAARPSPLVLAEDDVAKPFEHSERMIANDDFLRLYEYGEHNTAAGLLQAREAAGAT